MSDRRFDPHPTARSLREGAWPADAPRDSARQLTLDLPLRPALGRADFLVAAANETAVALLDRWPRWPGRAAAIYGPAGCGKSHLGAVWQEQTGAVVIGLEAVTPESAGALGAGGPLVLDCGDGEFPKGGGRPDADGPGHQFEAGLFHLLNRVAQKETGLLVLSRRAPARWTVALPDLKSRLSALSAAEIAPPDDALLGAVLTKLFKDRQIGPGADLIPYLVPRMERSLAAANRLVALIDQLSLAAKKPVSRRIAQEALKLLEQDRLEEDRPADDA